MAYEGPHPLPVPSGGTGRATLTAHDLIVGNGTTQVSLVAPSATSGVPLISQGAAADPTFGTAVVSGGGTGDTSFTAYSVICGGTTTTNPLQSVASVGTTGQILTSNGAGALPTFQAPAASSISITGDTGGALTGNAFTFTGGTTGLKFDGAGSTETVSGTLVVANGGTGSTSFNTKGVVVSGATTTTALTALTLTNGQVVIGSTAGSPSAATLTAGSGISITNGSNSISIAATGANSQIVIQTFTSSGTYTPTTGMDYCIIEVIGGGGAGGGAAATTGAQFSSGAGGGGGEYGKGAFSAATIGGSQTVTIGAAGTANSGAAGGNGGTSSVGALITALGGNGGNTLGPSASGAINGSAGGSGGTGGSFHIPGGTGNYTFYNNTINLVFGGFGGGSVLGVGGNAEVNQNSAGNTGLNYGAGGGGANNGISQSARSGGPGTSGIVIITEFI